MARISAYTDFLREEAAPQLNDEHRGFLKRLRSGATRMQHLLDDLLDYATADNRALRTAPVNLADLVTDLIAERTSGPVEHPPVIEIGPLPTCDGDVTLLRQAFDNLISNALKYTRHGHPAHVQITAANVGDSWQIEINDHGIGIPDTQRDSIFTAFTRATGSEGYPGTGLGLAIVHRIIERHGGQISVTSNAHGGSRFCLMLPTAAHVPAASTPAPLSANSG